MKTYNLTNNSSNGKEIYKTTILENATISEIKEKYLQLTGRYCEPIFDKNFADIKSGKFTLPNSYSTFLVKENK